MDSTITSLRWRSMTTSACSENFGSDCSHKCEQNQIVNTGCWRAVVEDSYWRPGTPKAPFCTLLHFNHGHPSTAGCRLLRTLFSYAHSLIQPYWTIAAVNTVCTDCTVSGCPATSERWRETLSPCTKRDLLRLLRLSAIPCCESFYHRLGKQTGFCPLFWHRLCLLLELLSSTSLFLPETLLLLPFPACAVPLPLPFLLLSYSSCFPCTRLSQQFTLNSPANHTAFVQLHTPLRLTPCLLCWLWVQVTAARAGATSWRC